MGKIKNIKMTSSVFNQRVKKFKQAGVLLVGDFILDQFIWGKVDRISPEAPVPVVHVEKESYMPGGALNVAHNIRELGGHVFPCGIVGRDLLGRMLVKTMRQHGVETGGIIYDADRPTTQKTRIIAHSQQVVRFDREKAGDLTKAAQKKIMQYALEKIQSVQGIVIEDYGKGIVTPGLIKAILKLAKQHKKFVMVDPKEKHFSYYKGVTLITPNRKEAFGAVSTKSGAALSATQVGKQLLKKLNCEAVLLTMGEEGMLLFEKKGGVTNIPTAAQEVYDVSGAGDTCVAVLALAYASGATLKEAAYLSNLAAGVVVGKLGTASITVDELTAAYQTDLSIRK